MLLDRVAAPELLADAVENHLKPYLSKKFLNLDTFLHSYCLETMDNISSTLSLSWETRVTILFEYIESTEFRINLALEVMRRVYVPWSDSIDEFFKKVNFNLNFIFFKKATISEIKTNIGSIFESTN